MGVIAGIKGGVNGGSTVGPWRIQWWGEPPEFVASNTAGGVSEACGPTDWKGWYEAYGYEPAVFPGEALSFTGDLENGKGVVGTAIVDRLIVTADIERGVPIKHRVEFSCNGTLTKGDAAVTDSTTPTIYCPTSLTVVRDGVDVDNCRFWRIILGARNKAYVDSSTAGQRRRVKGAIYGQWMYRVYTSDPSTLPDENTVFDGHFEVVANSLYWGLAYCRVHQVEDLGPDPEGEDCVGAIVTGAWNATYGTMAGSIVTPAGVSKFP